MPKLSISVHAFVSDHVNKYSLEDIQRSILVLCLDQPLQDVKDPLSEFGGTMLHGNGSQVNSGNRWFDKTLQVEQFFTCGTCL